MAAGVQRIAIYRLYDNVDTTDPSASINDGWGLIRHDGTYRPAYQAWQTVIRLFSSTRRAQRVNNRGVTLVALSQANQIVTVLWNQTDGAITIHTPHTPDDVLLSPLGDTVTLAPAAKGYQDEFDLPPCADPCVIEGEPRLLITPGNAPPAIYEVTTDGKPPVRLN
jgi:hypothetical protein